MLMNFTLAQYKWEGTDFKNINVDTFPRGQIVEFTNLEEFCHSSLLQVALA
jgi:hypothetical protein